MTIRLAVGDQEWLIDEETGEIIERPPLREGVSLVEYWQEQHADADAQEKAWDATKRTAAMVVFRLMRDADEWKHTGPRLRSRWVNGGTLRAAPREKVDQAVALGLLSEDDVTLLGSVAVKAYDPAVVDTLVEQEALTPTQRQAIVVVTPRAGHVRTEPLAKTAPTITREARVERDGGAS